MEKQLVGVIGGSLGHAPFDRRTWSGVSYYFFTALAQQGLLHRAIGLRLGAAQRGYYLAKNFRFPRSRWRRSFYGDPAFRGALGAALRPLLARDDGARDFLQIGAMYDLPAILDGRARCFSYHDGNAAEAIRNPYARTFLDPRQIDRLLDYERTVYQGLDHIFCMSDYLRTSFIENFAVPADRVTAIGAGINLDRVPPQPLEKRYDRPELLFIGVEFARKGGWELLDAFREVRARFPAARLHIVGPRKLSVPADRQSGVCVHGFLSKRDPAQAARLHDLLARATLFLMPSLYEPFGIAPLEALAHQVPCVVSDGWALKELIRPGQTGALVPVGDARALAETTIALLRDPGKLHAMGRAGREQVLRAHTWDKVVARLRHALGGAACSLPDALVPRGPRTREP